MPSTLHEALVALFQNEPRLAPELLERAFGIRAPDRATAILQDVTLNQVAPTEYRADAVVVLRDERPVQAIVVEVQLREDDHKAYSWPVYVTTLRARLRCPVDLLVVTPHPVVARWAARPIEIGHGHTLSPLVLGPDLVPEVATVEEARRNPELAVLSALAHGRETSAETLADTVVRAVLELDVERATLYYDTILSALDDAVRTGLEELMKTKYEYQSDFAKKYFSQGLEEGRRMGLSEMLGHLLRRVGVELDPATRARLEASPVELLERIAAGVDPAGVPADILASIHRLLGGPHGDGAWRSPSRS